MHTVLAQNSPVHAGWTPAQTADTYLLGMTTGTIVLPTTNYSTHDALMETTEDCLLVPAFSILASNSV
jgi:hypothetical protein